MSIRTWYLGAYNQPVNWDTVIVGGKSTDRIVRAVQNTDVPWPTLSYFLWATEGQAVSAEQLAEAKADDYGGYPPAVTYPVPAAAGKGAVLVDVRSFGAKGDDQTKDSAAFQQAIDQVAALGGGIVYVPPGIWLLHNVHLATGVALVGAGRGVTVLKAYYDKGAPATTSIVVRVSAGSTTAASGVRLVDLTIDGNKTAWGDATSTFKGYGYYLGCDAGVAVEDCSIERVEFRNCKTYACDVLNAKGVKITDCWSHDNGWAGGGTNNGCSGFEILGEDVTLTNCTAWGNASKGFITGEGGVVHHGTKFVGCTARDNANEGFYLHDGVQDCEVTGCEAYGNLRGISVNTGALGCSITGNLVHGNVGNGIRLDNATFCSVTGNTVRDNATGSSGDPDLYLTGTSTDNAISGNVVRSTTATNSISEGSASCDRNVFGGNVANHPVVTQGASSRVL